MQKKLLTTAFLVILTAAPALALGSFQFGIGSGYVFYGENDVRERNKSLSDATQVVIDSYVSYRLQLAEQVYFAVGADSTFDFRWHGGKHIYLLDYAALAGFQIYPGVGGLALSVDYALGRRSDFYELDEYNGETHNTGWGNGFKFGIQYDFSYHTKSTAPLVGLGWRRMPRGNGADNILSVFLKLTIR